MKGKGYDKSESFLERPVSVPKMLKTGFDIDSKVLKRKATAYGSRSILGEDINFIRTALGNSRGLQLLFRASQHSFKAKEFHTYCDDIEDTFILVRT